jgi:AraC-like DNA-binding protein
MDVFDSAHVASVDVVEVALEAPWGVVVPPGESTYFYVVLSGACWLSADGLDEPIALAAGDAVTLVAGGRHVWRSDLSVAEDDCESRFTDAAAVPERGGGSETRLLVLSAPRGSNRFVSVYPAVVVIPHTERESIAHLLPLIRLVRLEHAARRPGKEAVLRRLGELIVIELVRFALPRLTANGRNWLGGLNDRHVGQAIALMHAEVGRDWSLRDLSAAVGLSRASFVERFTRLVGEPPRRYLRRVRMYHAAQALERTDTAIIDVAESVGYQSESAFNKVFAKEMGITPGRYRTLHRER